MNVLTEITEPASEENWTLIIKPHTRWWDLHLEDVWRYRDLLWLFVRRDFVAGYKQTILGPLWFFIQPLLTTLMFTIVFSGIAKIPTDGYPPILFYLAGTTPWNYFANCLTSTSNTFVANANLFGKVYFPRLVVPLSIVISNLIQFLVQFMLFIFFIAWYRVENTEIRPSLLLVITLTPVLLLLMGLLGLGVGVAISSLTTKYRDLVRLVTFGVQLLMYATPVIYPISAVPESYRWLLHCNPLSAIIESFRAIYLGGSVPWPGLLLSAAISICTLAMGVVLFNKVEKSFMDTI